MALHDLLSKTVTASVKMQRISPRKARLVADLIRYRSVTQALLILKSTNKKASSIILKLLNSAIANATNNAGLDAQKLYVSEILVGDGPTMKRFQPHSQGRAFPILKRTSNFYIKLSEIASHEEVEKMIKNANDDKNKEIAKPMDKEVEKKIAKTSEPKKTVSTNNKKATNNNETKKETKSTSTTSKPKSSVAKKPTAKENNSSKGGK